MSFKKKTGKEGYSSVNFIYKNVFKDDLIKKNSPDSQKLVFGEQYLESKLKVVSCTKCTKRYLNEEMATCIYCLFMFCKNCSDLIHIKDQNRQFICTECVLKGSCCIQDNSTVPNSKLILDMDYIHENISNAPLLKDEDSLNEEDINYKRLRSQKRLLGNLSDTQEICINCINCKTIVKLQNCYTCSNEFCRNSYCISCVLDKSQFTSCLNKNKLKGNLTWFCFNCKNNNNYNSIQLNIEKTIQNNESLCCSFSDENENNNRIVKLFYNCSNEKDPKNQNNLLSYADVFFQTNYGKDVDYSVIKQNCFLCENNMFCVNELIRFRRQNELIKYIKKCYMEKSWCFSYNCKMFTTNKCNFAIFVKQFFEKKQISAPFKVVKVFCKLCFIKLINCSDIVKLLKLILTEKKYNTKKTQLKTQKRYKNCRNKSSKLITNEIQVNVSKRNTENQNKSQKGLNTSDKNKNKGHHEIQSMHNDKNDSMLLNDKTQINININTHSLLKTQDVAYFLIETLTQDNCNSIINCFNSIYLVIQQLHHDSLKNTFQYDPVLYDCELKKVIDVLVFEKNHFDIINKYQNVIIKQYIDHFKQNVLVEPHNQLLNQLLCNQSIYLAFQSVFQKIIILISDFTSDINRYYLLIDLINKFKYSN